MESTESIPLRPSPEEISKVLKMISESLMSSSLIYCHREFPSVYLGRDLVGWLQRAERPVQSVILSCAASGETPLAKNPRVTDLIHSFLQLTMDLRLLSGVHQEERTFFLDSFYVIELCRVPEKEVDKKYNDMIEFLKKNVVVEDRRMRIRSYTSFLKSEAKALLEKHQGYDSFDRLEDARLVSCVCEPDFYQFVPRVVHSGFFSVTLNSNGSGFARKWVVLREKTLQFFYENKKQLHFEVELTLATAEALDPGDTRQSVFSGMRSNSSNNVFALAADVSGFQWLIVTQNERIHCMTPSFCERQMWLQMIVSLMTVVSEENQLIEQAEAIIVSTSFFRNASGVEKA